MWGEKKQEEYEHKGGKGGKPINVTVGEKKSVATILMILTSFPAGTADKLIPTVEKMAAGCTVKATAKGILINVGDEDIEKLENSLRRIKINQQEIELSIRK